jgi:hypothetical protein
MYSPAVRCKRVSTRLRPDLLFHALAWPHQAKHGLLCDVLDDGLFPTFASIIGAKFPDDRPIDSVDQTDVLFGRSETGRRESLLSFIGGDLVAARWKQWRVYFTDIHPTGTGPQRQPGPGSASAPMAGYPKIFNIEADPHEDLNVFGLFPFVGEPALKVVEEYLASVKKYPNPPAPNVTQFHSAGGG